MISQGVGKKMKASISIFKSHPLTIAVFKILNAAHTVLAQQTFFFFQMGMHYQKSSQPLRQAEQKTSFSPALRSHNSLLSSRVAQMFLCQLIEVVIYLFVCLFTYDFPPGICIPNVGLKPTAPRLRVVGSPDCTSEAPRCTAFQSCVRSPTSCSPLHSWPLLLAEFSLALSCSKMHKSF